MRLRLFYTVVFASFIILALPLTTVFILRNPFIKPKSQPFQQEVVLKTPTDNLKMRCLYLKADQAKGNIIFLHGIRGNYNHFYPTALKFREFGYNCLLVNLRGHGNSGGAFTTYGAKEKHDIAVAFDYVNNVEELPTGIWGTSLGAAIGLQTMAEYDSYDFGIIESTFCQLDEVVDDYFTRFTTIRSKSFSSWLIDNGAKYADFEDSDVSPEESCKSIHCPTLIVHGVKDRKMDLAYADRNFEALSSNSKELFLVQEANHQNVLTVGGEDYLDKVNTFISDAIKK